MARHVTPRLKAVSSGRLTGSGRGQMIRKKVAGTPLHLDPSYSLYSTDSEDQVATINKGLDRCAALLSNLLEAEKADPKTKSRISNAAPSKKKTSLGRNEAERKWVGKKTSAVARINKKPAPVQKTILRSETSAGLKRQQCVQGGKDTPHVPAVDVTGSEVKVGGTSMTGPQPSTVFNSLTTSTPSPSAHSPPSSDSQALHREADGATTHHFPQRCAGASVAPSSQHGPLSTTPSPSQYTFSAVQLQPEVLTSVSAVHPGPLKTCGPVTDSSAGVCGHSSALQAHSAPQICPNSPAPGRIPTPVSLPTYVLKRESSLDNQISSGECSSKESGDCMSEEDEMDRVDVMPVRDTSCQSSMNKLTGMLEHKNKSESPEKTVRKVMTVKYLLGELKALVANQDAEAVRLICEVEQNISLLPAMVGSTNIQAELALALQPIRSENVQLRRRVRILNQQLQERERAERQARPVDSNLELDSLQSLNLSLQTQLNDHRRELENLQQENQKLRQDVEDRESDLRQTKEQCELETSRIRMDVSEALAKMRLCQVKLEDSERERTAMTHILQQKEAELTKLQEIIRNLQKSPIPCHPAQTDVSRSPVAPLTKNVLDQYENQQRDPSMAKRVTDSVKAYLETLEDSGCSSPPYPAHPQPHKLPLSSPSQSQWKHAQGSPHESQKVAQNETAFVPLRETARVQSAPVSQKPSPVQENDHVGPKYLGLVFNKLAISNDLPALGDNKHCTDLQLPSGMSLLQKQPSESAANAADYSQSQHARRHLQMSEALLFTGRSSGYENSFTSCDIKSLASDWSVTSWSTFNTHDEQQFRNGLAALDASIASLQRTLKADLKR